MRTYIYQLKDPKGKILRGFESARNKKHLRAKIVTANSFFVSAQEADRKAIFRRKVKSRHLFFFTTRLRSLVDAGIPILKAMMSLWRQTEDVTLQLVISDIVRKLSEGKSLSKAMSSFPNIFPGVYLSMVKVAEETGELVQVLDTLVHYLEYQKMVNDKIKKATTYPLFVIALACVLMMSMFTFIVPVFAGLLDDLDVKMPWVTRAVLAVSHVLRGWVFWVSFFGFGISGALIFKNLLRNKRFVRWFDRAKLKVPVFGNLMYMITVSRFVNSLRMLIKAGLPILRAFESCSEVVRNSFFQEAVEKMSRDVERGLSIEDAFSKTGIFPDMVVEMVAIGEASGDMANMLGKAGSYMEDDVDMRVSQMLALLEPTLIIFVGGMIAVTLVAIYLPIFTIWQGVV